MTRYLANNCYCNGNLITEDLTINRSLHLQSLDINTLDADVVSAQSVLADDATIDDKVTCKDLDATGNIACSGTITALNANATNIDSLTVSTHAIDLNDQSVNSWQDLVDNHYINVPIPTDASVITEGSNVLYDDLHNSTGKIVSSDPIFFGDEPYHYCKQTTWSSTSRNTYQQPLIEVQLPTGTHTDLAYYNYNVHSYKLIPVKEDSEDSEYNVHDNSMYESVYNHHGKRYTYLHSDTHTSITLDNSDGDLIGIARLYNTTDLTTTYDVVVRAHSITINDEEIAMPFNLTHVAAYSYLKNDDSEFYPIELIVVSESSDAGEFWNICVIKNGEVVYTRTLTTADQVNDISWFKANYPCVFHVGSNDNTLMIVCHGNNGVNGKNYITHYTVAYTQGNDAPITPYNSFDVSSDAAWIGSYMRLKQYFTSDGLVILASDWNFDANNGDNDMTFEHYNNTYGFVEVINPLRSGTNTIERYYTPTSTQTGTNHNYIIKGIVDLAFSSDSSITGNDTNRYLIVFKMEDQNYAIWSWSTGSNNTITFNTGPSTAIYNNSARFVVVYNPTLPHQLINRIELCYCNWNCRSPYIVYSTASPYSNPHGPYDERSYFVAYYQLFNINHQTSSSSYIIPTYLTNNKALVSDGRIYNNS